MYMGETWREKARGRVLERITGKLRSVPESNPGKLGSAVKAATPVSATRKQLPGLTVGTNIFFSCFLKSSLRYCEILWT